MDRRSFLTTTGAAVVAATVPDARAQQPRREKARFRTGLVAYSYRQALQAKTMTYEDLIRIAVETGTDGIDMTVYWLKSSSGGKPTECRSPSMWSSSWTTIHCWT